MTIPPPEYNEGRNLIKEELIMDKDLIEKAKAVRDRAGKLSATEYKLSNILKNGGKYVPEYCTGSLLGTENWDELDWLLADLIRHVNNYCDVLEENIKELEKKIQALPKNDADQEQGKE